MPGKCMAGMVLRLFLGSVCAATGMHANAQAHEPAYPDANFLEYLANLEEVDGEWLGPEQMENLHNGEQFPEVSETRIAPEPAQMSVEQEEKK